MNFDEKRAKLEQIYRILVGKMEQNMTDLSIPITPLGANSQDHLSKSPSLDSIKIVVKSNLLKFNLQKKMLSSILGEAAREKDFSNLRGY